jgi:hypothetical protein
MNLLTCLHKLPWPFAAGAARALHSGTRARADEVAPDADTPDDAAADIVRSCGWFDSSHELQQGLLVREHSDPTALAAEMPLGPWLDLHLGHWRPTLAA